VATLQEIGQDWGKRLEKGLAKEIKIGCFFLAPFRLVHHSIVSLSPSQEDGRGEGSRAGPPFGEEENIWPPTWNYRGNGSKILSLSGE
jgi:hypothetical protein